MAHLLSSPLSLYSIPVAWLTAFYPAVLKYLLVNRTIGYDNKDPRGEIARMEKKDVPNEVIARARRMNCAHLNGLETFPLWATAVVVANIAGVDHYTLNVASIAFVSSRLLYNWVYFSQKTRAQSGVRSIIFTGSVALPLYLLTKSADIVYARGA